MNKLNLLLKNEVRFLLFRDMPAIEFLELRKAFLVFGILSTLIAGFGRYWDNPRAELWQLLGLGSLAYIFILATILWLLILPLKPKNWSYLNILTFLGMTSPLAFLYAIPVERFMSLGNAQMANVWFLAVVAVWRVSLLFKFLISVANLTKWTAVIALMLPLVLIVSSLTAFNLEHVVFRIMAGIEDHERSGNDAAYFILMVITYFSVMATPVFGLCYIVKIWKTWKNPRESVDGA